MTYAVAIPAYNSERTIADTLESVVAQTVVPSEIVVVDDGSTDATADIVRSFDADIRVITQVNTGCGGATTQAIKRATKPRRDRRKQPMLWKTCVIKVIVCQPICQRLACGIFIRVQRGVQKQQAPTIRPRPC